MIDIKKSSLSLIFIFLVFGCIEPNTEDLWNITIESVLGTDGYVRDVHVENNLAFLAAGEAGAQIWDLSNGFQKIQSFSLDDIGSDKEITQVHYSSLNKLMQLLEYNERAYIMTLDDSLYNIESSWGQWGAEDTRGFVISDSAEQFTYYSVIKKDHFLKWGKWEYLHEYGGYWSRSSVEGESAEIDIYATPTSIALSNKKLIIGIGQLGVQIWELSDINSNPLFQASIDLDGSVESITLVDENSLFIAKGSYGASFIPLDQIEIDIETNSIINNIPIAKFAEDLNVNHIAVNNNIAALSLGSKGIALYDITDYSSPIEKGIYPIGYSYKAQFWGEKLLVCTREGLQIISIN
tara:strand:- start:253 stop:1305 length:1053 start_codon:yes stop_codon:yes gene_type:complete